MATRINQNYMANNNATLIPLDEFDPDTELGSSIAKRWEIPFDIRQMVDDAINKLLNEDIIEKVPDTQPNPWVSPIVEVPQKDNSIRLCIDMRRPNVDIKRTRHPIPTVKDINVLLDGACYFSKLDVRQRSTVASIRKLSVY